MKGKCHLKVKKEITHPEDKGEGRFTCILKLIWEGFLGSHRANCDLINI